MSSEVENGSFRVLLAALEAGEDTAWTQVAERFTTRLIGLARSRLDGRLRQKLDPQDVVQSVYRTFHRRLGPDRFRLHSWDALAGLLIVLTVRKCARAYRTYYQTQSRDIGREVPDESLLQAVPTPDEVAGLLETLEDTLQGFDEEEKRVIKLGFLGYEDVDIGREEGVAEEIPRLILQQYAQHLRGLLEPGTPGASRPGAAPGAGD